MKRWEAKEEYWEPLAKLVLDCIEKRCEQDITVAELAKKMGVEPIEIEEFENYESSPSYGFVVKLVLALGYKLELKLV
jgi:transcriptional regulator with XRE-family HTH domain